MEIAAVKVVNNFYLKNLNLSSPKGPNIFGVATLFVVGYALILLASLLPAEFEKFIAIPGVIFWLAGFIFGLAMFAKRLNKMSK